MDLKTGIILSEFTTYKIGGPADYFVTANTTDDLKEALQWTWSKNLPYKILGKGSNVLISDKGFRGLIIFNSTSSFQIQDFGENAVLFADSGVILDDLSKTTGEEGWHGLEWAVGIPGTTGGAILTNAGTSAGNIASCLDWITVFNKDEGLRVRSVNEMMFDYRTSIYKIQPQLLTVEGILSAQFRLKRGDKSEIAATINKRVERRAAREPRHPNAGSIFKNPDNGSVREMVAECGLKGFREGGAEIPDVAPSFIINKDNASAEDVLKLVVLIKRTIYEKYRIILEPEVEFIGEWNKTQQDLLNILL